MKDIIERITELPADKLLWIGSWAKAETGAKLSTDDLKQMAEELAGYREMLEDADEINFESGRTIRRGMLKWTIVWPHISPEFNETHHPDALSAFRSLQEKS